MTTEARGNFDPTSKQAWHDLQASARITQATAPHVARKPEAPTSLLTPSFVRGSACLPFDIHGQPEKLVKNRAARDLAVIGAEMVTKQNFVEMGMPDNCLPVVTGCLEENTASMLSLLDSSDKVEKKRGRDRFIFFINSASDTYRRQRARGVEYHEDGTVVFNSKIK